MQIKVKSNLKGFSRWMQSIHKKQVPFATMLALNDTAFYARNKIVKETYPEAFELKIKRFPALVTRVKKASKKKLEAQVGDLKKIGLSFLSLHEEGGTKLPYGRSIAIPIGKNENKRNLRKKNPPTKVMAEKGFIIKTKTGKRVMFKRKGEKLEPQYLLVPKAVIRKALDFYKDGQQAVQAVFQKNFENRFYRAIQTAK